LRKGILLIGLAAQGWAQEASSGLELRSNLSVSTIVSPQLKDAPRLGSQAVVGLRTMLYPTWKFNENWTISSAIQVHTRPYFMEELNTQGFGLRSDVLQLHLTYSRFWERKSLVARAGQLSSAFGSYLLRYDDAENAVLAAPLAYGYYYKPITTYALTGAQIDLTLGNVDLRAQLTNSSPTNRRSMFDSDQYGNWAGGVGYTIVQGLRIGTSGFRGPYLHREHPYYFANEKAPSQLPAFGAGVDVDWSRGHWAVRGEWQYFHRSYQAIPNFIQKAFYTEVRRVLHPRWYLAARTGSLSATVGGTTEAHELAVGYRPNSRQLIKAGYEIDSHTSRGLSGTFAVQIVTSLRPITWSRSR
jgi:hypothetical protein